MNMLRPALIPCLAAEQDHLVDTLFLRVAHADAPHYQADNPELLRMRCRDAVAAFRCALEHDATAFRQYIRTIAVERAGAGYRLQEVQLVLSTLEELMWTLCIEHVDDKDELVRALSVVSGIAGQAKDELARVYLEQIRCLSALGRTHAPDVDLLFDGT